MAISRDRLKKIAASAKLTDRDKKYVEKASDEVGISFAATACGDCYRDQCHVILRVLAERDGLASLINSDREKFLRPCLDVLFNGERVNAGTITTDKQIDDLLAEGFPPKFVYNKEELKAYGLSRYIK